MSSYDEKNADLHVGDRSASSEASGAPASASNIEAGGAGANAEVDQAWKFLNSNRDAADEDTSSIDMKALRRKIDLRVVPLLFLCYTMQFLDKVILNVSVASLAHCDTRTGS